ncbi:hypothetical protein ACOSP7_021227 [Xanthoceras sorbifolium]
MLTSISSEIIPELIGCLTSSEAWIAIEKRFSSHSTENKMQLKMQLQTLKKGSLTMIEYLLKKKSIFNALAHT